MIRSAQLAVWKHVADRTEPPDWASCSERTRQPPCATQCSGRGLRGLELQLFPVNRSAQARSGRLAPVSQAEWPSNGVLKAAAAHGMPTSTSVNAII
eukprot:m.120232 g.120232  ORF g.120232 m.120232 type:complete len:97 (+) comp9268_c0_seq4:2149-2439(+)